LAQGGFWLSGTGRSVSAFSPPGLKGGDDDMALASVEMEVERAMNLLRGFGWSKVKEEIVNDEIHITIKKKSEAAAAAGPEAGPT